VTHGLLDFILEPFDKLADIPPKSPDMSPDPKRDASLILLKQLKP
jgi:hypothetical protein